ncbi:hypothetical protein SynBIOSU31_02701 [Synechococcus sp. BIOS-U3-1]|nr:hypothetical protein SynBIOSU31_02701 [Synechococcus sp. BIOS-U3-1]
MACAQACGISENLFLHRLVLPLMSGNAGDVVRRPCSSVDDWIVTWCEFASGLCMTCFIKTVK